jgi:hypothetical protein
MFTRRSTWENTHSLMPMNATVHFSGTWTARQKDQVRDAVHAYEQKRRAARRTETRSADARVEWIAVSTPLDDAFYYFAHRQGIPESLAGRTVDALAREISDFGAAIPDS